MNSNNNNNYSQPLYITFPNYKLLSIGVLGSFNLYSYN